MEEMTVDALKVKNHTLKGRIVMPPMATEKSDHGMVTPAMGEYYAERAKNPEVGIIITEHSYIAKQGQASPGQVSIASDDTISGLKNMTDAVHAASEQVMIFAQINHAGGNTNAAITGIEGPSVSASAETFRRGESRPLTVEEIHAIEDQFADAARRAKEAGFDGVQIHSAHGYLLNQFYSPLVNHRTDEYGAQSMENRLRFHLETIEKVRKAVGEDYPVSVRLGGCDYMDGGSTIEDSVEAAKIFEKAGIDLLDISGGMCSYTRKDMTAPGWFQDMTSEIVKNVTIPVILTGGITTRAEADALLKKGAADLIGIGRALLKDAVLK